MNCNVCGKPSGKYFLCKECNQKKEEGLIVKNDKGEWVMYLDFLINL